MYLLEVNPSFRLMTDHRGLVVDFPNSDAHIRYMPTSGALTPGRWHHVVMQRDCKVPTKARLAVGKCHVQECWEWQN